MARQLRFAAICALIACASGVSAQDRLFVGKGEYEGKPVWELLSGCSGFAQAVAAYFKTHGALKDHKQWMGAAVESYSAAQYRLGLDRQIEDDAATRALINPIVEMVQAQYAGKLAAIDPTSGTQEAFTAESLILHGTYAQMCFAASFQAGE